MINEVITKLVSQYYPEFREYMKDKYLTCPDETWFQHWELWKEHKFRKDIVEDLSNC